MKKSNNSIFQDILTDVLVDLNKRFGGINCLQFQIQRVGHSSKKANKFFDSENDPVSFSKRSVNSYQSTPLSSSPYSYSREKFKSPNPILKICVCQMWVHLSPLMFFSISTATYSIFTTMSNTTNYPDAAKTEFCLITATLSFEIIFSFVVKTLTSQALHWRTHSTYKTDLLICPSTVSYFIFRPFLSEGTGIVQSA
jgi:hypothetical protein